MHHDKLKRNIEFKVREPATLLDFIMKAFDGISRSSAKSCLTNRRVMVNSTIETRHDFALTPGMVVEVSRGKGQHEFRNRYLKLLYEDPYLLVVEKAAGLLTIATAREKEKTAHVILNDYARKSWHGRVFVVHRLDRDTSGILVFAKDEKTKTKLQERWNEMVKVRGYVAIVCGEMEKDSGTVTSWLRENAQHMVYSSPVPGEGDLAVTNYKTLARKDGYSLVGLELETGRRNQIRVHMSDLGHPVTGDKKYGNGDDPIGRLALHAYRLEFIHPVTGKAMKFEIPYPAQFKQMFKQQQ